MLKLKRLRPSARIPANATPGSAGYDLCADLDSPVTIPARRTVKIPTGLAMAIEPGYAGFVFARSGLGIKHGIVPANCVGVIDSDYRGELTVGLVNHGDVPYTIQPGDRIAQLMVLPILRPTLTVVEELDETERGAGGFGSTGR